MAPLTLRHRAAADLKTSRRRQPQDALTLHSAKRQGASDRKTPCCRQPRDTVPLPTQRRLAAADPTPRRQASAGAIPAPSRAHIPDPPTPFLRRRVPAPVPFSARVIRTPVRAAANFETPYRRQPQDALAPPTPRCRGATIPET